MNKCLTADMADANRLQIAIRPTRFFNIKKMAADFCSAQCIMDNTGSLSLFPFTLMSLLFVLADLNVILLLFPHGGVIH